MEYAKDELFTINYNEGKDELEFIKRGSLREKLRKKKILSLFFSIGIIFAVCDITFIYYFFSLLTKI